MTAHSWTGHKRQLPSLVAGHTFPVKVQLPWSRQSTGHTRRWPVLHGFADCLEDFDGGVAAVERVKVDAGGASF